MEPIWKSAVKKSSLAASIGSNAAVKLPGRNEPCWCGSGSKFKKCHYRRDAEQKANFHDTANAIHKAAKKGRCLHPSAGGGACGAHAIASHTVQRSGGLAAIAEEGHVLTTFLDVHDLRSAAGSPEPKKIGVKIASTFPGFCNKHDSELFAPIEQESLVLGQHAAFLFLYRALCLELVRKRHVAEKTVPALRSADAGQPLIRQIQIQSLMAEYSTGISTGLRDLEQAKAHLDAKLGNQDWSGVHYVGIEFDGVLPVTSTFAIQPEEDWQGRALQDLTDLALTPDAIAVAVTSYEKKGRAIFAWLGDAGGVQGQFVDSFLALPQDAWAGSLLEACFELSENTQIRPSWWASLEAAARKSLNEKILHGTTASSERYELGAPLAIKLSPTPKVCGIVDSRSELAGKL